MLRQMPVSDHHFCVAPMMDWTDRHERYLLRLLTRHARLYTEMVTTGALLHGDSARFLAHDPVEYPLALQLGGSEPDAMAVCAQMGEDAGYHEININIGCPSDRVQSGRFGACLMREPDRVAACVRAMSKAISIPVTVKCRIGVDLDDRFEQLVNFVDVVSSAGCTVFIVHARKAWLSGLSPRQNREIPPLDYPRVYQLKARFPELTIVINGGICQWDQVQTHLSRVDGVMVGREAYQNPYRLATVDHELFGFTGPVLSRWQVLELYKPYIRRELERGVRLKQLSRHLLGLFQGQPGARNWRRTLSERGARAGAGIEVIDAAEAQIRKDGDLHLASQVTQPVHFAA